MLKKVKKFLCITLAICCMIVATTAFAGSATKTWQLPYHNITGKLTTSPGYIAYSSTTINGSTAGHESYQAYAYVEGVDVNGIRIGSGIQAYGKPTATTSNLYVRSAAYFNSAHNTTDPGDQSQFLQLSAMP